MTNLLDLPPELLHLVLPHLDPFDLINLGEVNRAFHGTLSQRWIWGEALRSTCRQAGVFESTFGPLDGLDLTALKKASLRPTLLVRKLSNNNEISPASEVTLICDNTSKHYTAVHVVPGGRYVVGATYRAISVWDLGQPSSLPLSMATSNIPPQATTQLEEGTRVDRLLEPSLHGMRSIRFLAHNRHSPSGTFRICVYEIGPLPENCSIRTLAELQLGQDRALHRWISGDRVYIHQHNLIAVWDYLHSRLIMWPIYLGMPHGFQVQMTDLDGAIILLGANGMYTWGVPKLEKMLPPSALQRGRNEVANEPTYTRFRDDTPEEVLSTNSIVPSSWCMPSTWKSTTAAIVESQLEGSYLTSIRLEVVDGRVRATLLPSYDPPPDALTRASSPIVPYSQVGNTMFAVRSFTRGGPVRMFVSATPGNAWQGGKCSTAHSPSCLSLVCPVSARYAYICTGNQDHSGPDTKLPRIHVVNLLPI